ncbi:MAG: MFS transporter [Alphaproteobacteria bacterium]|nr:MFS transporter [Alphaproteobacteria bacterium]
MSAVARARRPEAAAEEAESAYAWLRLGAALALGTIGSAGLWAIVVVMPSVETTFAASRSEVSLAYTSTMLGFGLGGIAMGRLSDRFGILRPVAGSAVVLAAGYALAGWTSTLWQFALVQGALIGFASGATFGPLMADISLWFSTRRGIAVSICASGNYLAGTVWPLVLQHFVDVAGWRQAYIGFAVLSLCTMLPLSLFLRRPSPRPRVAAARSGAAAGAGLAALGLTSGQLQALLIIAGVACCVAMAMPQGHIVAYCGDLGYGVARGAEMLSVMLGCGMVSRIASGWVADRIGGLRTLLLGSALQAVALVLYLLFTGLNSLFVISALFGLFQGGIVPSYAIVVRECFPSREAGARVGMVVMATLVGMALGGWMSGAIFDLTGAYRAAFANGVLWNLLNLAIACWLLRRARRLVAFA